MALLFACALALFAGLVLPVASAFIARRNLIAEVEQRLASAYARRKDKRILEARHEGLERVLSQDSGLIIARSEEDAVQQFQQVCRKLMALHDVELNGLRKVSTSREEGVVAVRLEASMRISVARVAIFIAALEFGEPRVFFERVRLTRNSSRQADSDAVDMFATVAAYAAFEQQEKTAR